uniref:Uncharacterized protein n=1 Tax=Timema cristinae TaxID=61476 RepID=A0A7R9CE48_TIMCR|nr:unnamed protein product [Timema cristinae]
MNSLYYPYVQGNRSRVSSLTRSQVATLKNFATNFNFANINANAALGRVNEGCGFVPLEALRVRAIHPLVPPNTPPVSTPNYNLTTYSPSSTTTSHRHQATAN